jgi:hypothetical protein
MKVNVIGKYNRSGIGKKSGKPYDLNYVQITYKKNGVEGLAVREIMLDSKAYPLAGIQIGKVYDLDMDNGYVLGFEVA